MTNLFRKVRVPGLVVLGSSFDMVRTQLKLKLPGSSDDSWLPGNKKTFFLGLKLVTKFLLTES